MREKLRNIVENNRYFEFFLQSVIVLSVIFYTFGTFEWESRAFYDFLNFSEIIFVIIFSLEYVVRIYMAPNRLKYIFSFYWIIDLISILPFYTSFLFEFVSFKVFRIFRLFKLFKLLRFSRAFNRFKVAASMAKEEIFIFIFIVLILTYFSSVWIYYFEHKAQAEYFSNLFDSFYWAVITLTTVWYWDITPITTWWRIFTLFMLLIWVWIITIPAWLVASAMTQAKKLESLEADASFKVNTEKVKDEISNMIK